jgi:hypothetical protein
LTSRSLAGLIVLGAALSYAAISAEGPRDALIIEKGGAVRVNTALYGKGAVPVGAILMWSGDPAKLPPGWVLCDGKNDTPDLSGRFIVGYAASPSAAEIKKPDVKVRYDQMVKQGFVKMKDTGGEYSNTISVAVGEHRHEVAGFPISAVGTHRHSIGSHYHNGGWRTSDGGAGNTGNVSADVVGYGVQSGGSTGGVAASRATTTTLDNRPPYMVLAYIMYVGK